MMATRSIALVLLGVVGAAALVSGAGAAAREEKNRPVTKVITLLKDMIAQMEKEGEEDEEVYETMGCWCETNDKEKTKSIADAESRIGTLSASIEELTADSSRLNTEIKNLQAEVVKNQEALDTATALRTKQLGEFNEEEKDMLQSISSLKSAVTVLSKQNGGAALLQVGEQLVMDSSVKLHSLLGKHKEMLTGVITPSQMALLNSFTQSGAGYAPQGGEIFGILSSMKENFETNLANSQKEEMENQKAYEDLKSAKQTEIKAGQDQADTKSVELGAVDEKNAQSKQDLEDTQDTLEADTAFLANVKEKCANMDAEYEERTKTRQMEIQAVSKALEFLSSDEAHDLFSRSLGAASFLQRKSESTIRTKVSTKLLEAAKKYDPRLSAIALRVRLDKFDGVKKSIQAMVDKLLKEKEDDFKHRDFCTESFNQNERETAHEQRTKDDLIAKVDDLTMTMDTLDKNIEGLKAEVAELQVQMKAAGEEREKMNKDFQVTVADQRATQKLLSAALNVLKGFYDKAALVQDPAGAPPPAGFKKMEKNGASGGVMGMMQQIIDDAKTMEGEALAAEEDSQKAYESFVNDTNTSVDEKVKDITNKSEQKAKAESDKVETEVQRDESLATLEALSQANADLHKSCDFLLKNFDLRAQSRDEEIEALKQGIAMFSGATFSALMQTWHGAH